MKAINGENSFSRWSRLAIARATLIAGCLFWAVNGLAQSPPPDDGGPTNVPLASWSFQDTTNWSSDQGWLPISFTNITFSFLGDGQASTRTLVVDTNVPAWLQYYVYEPTNAATNLTVDTGSVTFWFAPDWSSTNQGGTGPGGRGSLFEVGSFTPDSSYGWWSIYVDAGGNNIYFSTQTNDLSSNFWTYVSSPISWSTNYFHFIVLTYCATNTALYLDDTLVTNGPPLTVYPGLNALTNGFCIGGSSSGLNQSHGMFDLVATYNYPLDSNDIDAMFNWYYPNYEINPFNIAYMDFNSSSQNFSSYGTNLALTPVSISNNLASLFVVNSTADILYEIQGTTNLAQPNWFSFGFVYGSELTNLTLASVMVTNRPTLFLRIRSWISSDGSGLPNWWETLYFGTNAVDPNALDPAGDGWTIWQDFVNGYNPTVFHTPPAPQNLAAAFNSVASTANVGWQSSLGPVTGYTVQKYDQWTSQTTNFNFSQSTNNFSDTITDGQGEKINWLIGDYGPVIPIYYQVQAHYAGGDSAWSAPVQLEPSYSNPRYIGGSLPVALVAGPQGSAYLAAWGLPNGTATLRVKAVDEYAEGNYGNSNFDTIVDIPVASSTNGLYLLPNSLMVRSADSYGQAEYRWFVQTIDTNNNPSEPTYFQMPYNSRALPAYFDGRTQLKQNLIFQLRAANENGPFQFTEIATNNNQTSYSYPANYAYAGLYLSSGTENYFDSFLPFEENNRYRNFMLSLSPNQDVDGNGALTTGAGQGSGSGLALLDPPTYQFQPPVAGVTNIPSLLATNVTQWLLAEPYGSPGAVGISISGSPATYQLAANAQNIFGLQYQSTELAYGTGSGLGTTTLSAGGNATPSATSTVNIYSGAAQPQFQTKEYDFWQGALELNDVTSAGGNFIYSTYYGSPLPGLANFSPTNTSDLLMAGVGQSTLVNGYAKLSLANGYNGVYAYLGQYFDKAYQIATNGVITTNITGVLSPFGQFFATQPGPTALVTMPDPDTGARGTCTVYAISLNVDANHDGTMDTSFSGPDNTSQEKPMEFWVNDGYDTQGGVDVRNDRGGNTNYMDAQINWQRDLENFGRLWIYGVPKLPSSQGYSVQMWWYPVSGAPAINLFRSVETNGGIGYLTDTNVAAAQTVLALPNGPGLIFGQVPSSGTFTFPPDFFDGTNKYFLFEGAGIGEGELTLTIYKNSSVVAQASQWFDLHDIEDFYERASISNIYSGTTTSNWTSTIESSQPATANLCGNDTNFIVFVHGFDVGNWDWRDDSDTVLKRLYWAGFNGKFMSVKWPCETEDPLLFNLSELDAYKASTAMTGYLNQLRNRFPGYRLNLLVHSQGNAVVSEAVAQGVPFNTYILTQGAMPASSYDVNAPTNTTLLNAEIGHPTPDWQPMGYHGVYTNLTLTGKIVNFYNTNDYLLVSGTVNWEQDQWLKPQSPYGSDGTNVWEYVTGAPNMPITDSEVSRAFVARSRTHAVGAQLGLGGRINSSVDLHTQFGFDKAFNDHSAQWTWPIQTTRPYFQQVLRSCQIQPAP
jgi:hypothetical protein